MVGSAASVINVEKSKRGEMEKYFTWFLITLWFVAFSGNTIFFVFNLMNEHPGFWLSIGIFFIINFALAMILRVGYTFLAQAEE